MTLIQIPLRNDLDNYEFSTDLDGVAYKIEIVWNTRANLWSLILKDDEANILIGAIPLVVNSDLFGRFQLDNLPKGIMTLYDTSETYIEAEKTDLGVRCVLLYDEAA